MSESAVEFSSPVSKEVTKSPELPLGSTRGVGEMCQREDE